jgi:hypothetical protein
MLLTIVSKTSLLLLPKHSLLLQMLNLLLIKRETASLHQRSRKPPQRGARLEAEKRRKRQASLTQEAKSPKRRKGRPPTDGSADGTTRRAR